MIIQTHSEILELLQAVKDPEIPAISLVDLGIISEIIIENDQVIVELIPTFAGCPAINHMQNEVVLCLQNAGIKAIANINYNKAWSSDFITENGKAQILKFGLAPPPKVSENLMSMLEGAICPKCGSSNTQLMNPFGTTLCRSISYCKDCREVFEQFKPL